ncbi:sigma-54 interaction domain-containing protein [Peribacillus loiseleuriae]|uniref:sigma-54 interaction domain-containing protein n=1 Tax=Peribacillus loiseleuriae TaxID=1679170 RepID=UPI00069D09ED|nr:sigma 54-interacting transcriptional regulator [Peribacillus loiseleuriae]
MSTELEMKKEVSAMISKLFRLFPIKVEVCLEDSDYKELQQNCPVLNKVQKTGMDVFVRNKNAYETCAVKDCCPSEPFILKAITKAKKVVGVLLVTALEGKTDWLFENYNVMEVQLDFCTEWISNKLENEDLRTENSSIIEEVNSIFSFIQDPVLLVDVDGKIHNMSHRVSRFFNKIRNVLIGGPITEIISDSDWVRVKNMKKQQDLKVSVKLETGDQKEYLAMVKPLVSNGEIASFLINVTPIMDSKKKVHEQRVLYTFNDVKGISDSIQNVVDIAKRIAPSNTTVLLRGESGTGKEIFAQAIHRESHRKDGPFIALNCAAIPESLLESELFGHVKGAFTGSSADKPGRFELANEGTIFLDEIGDLPLPLQSKLLRVVQERKIERVGDTKSTPVNVRIITATHRNLEKLVANGQFREDLYYRLNVIPITIPPLRERREDIPILIDYYMKKFSEEFFRSPKRISEDAFELLLSNLWPGNIRELQNVVNHFVQLEIGDLVTIESLPNYLKHVNETERRVEKEAAINEKYSMKSSNRINEKEIIIDLLDQYGRDTIGKKRVASHLNISLPTLYRRISKFKIK